MLKNRLTKLEKSTNQNGEQKLYVARQDEDENQMKISGLNFLGTIEEGNALMEQYPSCLFVIMNIPD